MKVGELLDAYPELEAVLIAQAPPFARLRNPVLRRTVARVATLQQAAAVGGLEVRALVIALRRAAAQTIDETCDDAAALAMTDAFGAARPAWADEGRVSAVLDAEAMLAKGQVPLPVVTEAARALVVGQVLRVDAGFKPVPLVEALTRQGFRCWVREMGPERFEAYFGPRP
jgi:hypothetical protein